MNEDMHSNWQSTDGERNDPIVKNNNVSIPVQEVHETPAVQQTPQVEQPQEPMVHAPSINQGATSMRLAAASGIGLVLAGMFIFYIGVDYLRASILGDSDVQVTITADGYFAPSEIDVTYGTTVNIENEHVDPQVIKLRGDNGAFTPMILLEGESASLPITEAIAIGDYAFYSETLPQDREFIVHVVEQTQSAISGTNGGDPITTANEEFPVDLIPSLPGVTQTVQSSSSSQVSQPTVTLDTTPTTNETQTFDVAAQSSSAPFVQNAVIPTNPYTVGNQEYTRPIQTTDNPLHDGAPLKQPRSQPSTGIANWVFGAIGIMSLAIMIAWKRQSIDTV